MMMLAAVLVVGLQDSAGCSGGPVVLAAGQPDRRRGAGGA